jgi:hypothetical protein
MPDTFTQIIFPPNPKQEIVIKVPDNNQHVECWIIGEESHKVLYVQCPICYHSFKLATVMNEPALKEYIDRYPHMYYNAAIRECPEKDKHGSQVWHKVI